MVEDLRFNSQTHMVVALGLSVSEMSSEVTDECLCKHKVLSAFEVVVQSRVELS